MATANSQAAWTGRSMLLEILVEHIPELAAILVLLGCSAFFSGSETALFSLTHEDLRKIGLSGSRSSRHIQALLRDPQSLLAAVLFGNMLVNVGIYSLSFLIALHLSQEVSPVAGAACGAVSLLTVILFGETSPKGIAIGRPVQVAQLVATPLYLFHRAARPVCRMLCGIAHAAAHFLQERLGPEAYVTREELKMLVQMAEQHGVIEERARAMIERVVELGNLRARDVMTPRVDMPLFNLAAGVEGLRELMMIDREERVLVYEGTADNIIGVLNARDVLIGPEQDLRRLLKPVRFVPATQPAEVLLEQFRRAKDSVAVVVDEYGGTAGLVALENFLEEIVGEIREEREPREPPVVMRDEDTYVLAGDLSAREWRPLLAVGFEREGVDTIGGLVMSLLGRLPKEGDSVERRGLRFLVEKMQGRRILRVRVERLRREASNG